MIRIKVYDHSTITVKEKIIDRYIAVRSISVNHHLAEHVGLEHYRNLKKKCLRNNYIRSKAVLYFAASVAGRPEFN